MTVIKVSDLLIELIKASEKASQIARLCRKENELFQLLIEEKSEETKNPRFIQDFKTLADVLVQETARYDLSTKFPGIEGNIYGEENNKFMNALGESVIVAIQENQQKTSDLLLKVLDGNEKAARLLAKAVHSQQFNYNKSLLKLNHDNDVELNIEDIAIWIDPIDSTSEYVHGSRSPFNENGIVSTGLKCVTCLIGVYDRISGSSLIGVANQPFNSFNNTTQSWSSDFIWGFEINGKRANNLLNNESNIRKNLILIGGNESIDTINALKKDNEVLYAAGAGYKLLCVAQSLCDSYITSKPSTFRWDTCALHAILKSIGGGIVPFDLVLNDSDLNQYQLKYHELKYHGNQNACEGIQKWCNINGLIAYRNVTCLKAVINTLKNY